MGTPNSSKDGGELPKGARRGRWARLALGAFVGSIVLFLLGLEIWELWVLLGFGLYLRWVVRGR
ncbi:MAG: hypothetical protein H5T66_13010 [Chloroflexi bacterium]|nr:hypothetical protein [Chloroflexota bacterium]